MEREIAAFQAAFLKRFGILPEVYLAPIQGRIRRLDLYELVRTVEEVVDRKKYKAGIRTRCRKRDLVLTRQIYFQIARTMGYHVTEIGEAIGYNHASVIHGIRMINNLLETRNEEALLLATKIENVIKEQFGTDGDVQPDPEETADA